MLKVHRHSTAHRVSRFLSFLVPVLTTLLLVGCTFVGPYDETTDRAVTELQKKSDKLIDSINKVPMPTPADVAPAYAEIDSELRQITLRNELREKNELTLKQLALLDQQIDLVRSEHDRVTSDTGTQPLTESRIKALTSGWRESLNTIFRAILKLELAKKE